MRKNDKKKSEESYHIILVTCLVSILFVVFFGFGYAIGGVRTNNENMKVVSERQNQISARYDYYR